MSGLEVVGVVLGVFPIVIKVLENYQDGYDTLRDFAHFRREFTHLVNELNREQIIFRQQVEATLRSITDSEFELKEMMDNAQSERWKSRDLHYRLKRKLCGDGEYDNYQSSLKAIHDNLSGMAKRLNTFESIVSKDDPGQAPTSALMTQRLQKPFRRLHFVMRKKRWREQIVDLGRQIDRVGKLFGEAEALAPARQSRGSSSTSSHQIFAQARTQASSLHQAIVKAFICDCDGPHAFKLIMAKQAKSMADPKTPKSLSRVLKVSFPLCNRSWATARTVLEDKDAWCSFDTTMLSHVEENNPFLTEPSPGDRESFISSSSKSAPSTLPSIFSESTSTILDTPASSVLGSPPPHSSRKSSYAQPQVPSPGRPFPPLPAQNLCQLIRTPRDSVSVAYLNDGCGSYHVFNLNPEFSLTSADVDHVVNLQNVLVHQPSDELSQATSPLSRRHRMSIAVTLAYALLELYPSPWLPRSISKMDVYFFQRKNGEIMTQHPFVVCESSSVQQSGPLFPSKEGFADHSNALLALGIVIMELWFGQTLESRPFYREHCDKDGNEKPYTNFTAALEWQQKTIDEGGVALRDITNRCVRGNFGPSVMDLTDLGSVKAVHDEVVKPLEGIVGYMWPVT
ncbi:hypothetical protein B0T21DRAFT_448810 [Apiosordaria backusii]|uniref:DUF7580 domain-containing protein n=1 Tax=Apiosordaria backusii TaxID=314023 RepID=A0AA40EMI6_9PEZI|nr:hypothetical protein B0T21DRAFT_448810 [Apiosordaria backusii]